MESSHETTDVHTADGFFAVDRARTLLAMAGALTVATIVLPVGLRWTILPLAMLLPGHAMVCAIFGRHLEFGGVRRLALSAALTLTSYPFIALTALVLEMRLTKTVVVVGTDLLVAGCAAVVTRRSWLAEHGPGEPEPESEHYRDASIRLRELIIPVGAMALAMIVALSSVTVLPRRPPDAYSSIALEGTWALTSRAVPMEPSRIMKVQVRIVNRTREERDYTAYGQVVDGPTWSRVTRTLQPGETWTTTVEGRVKTGSCRSRLEIQMTVSGERVEHAPLALFLRDASVKC